MTKVSGRAPTRSTQASRAAAPKSPAKGKKTEEKKSTGWKPKAETKPRKPVSTGCGGGSSRPSTSYSGGGRTSIGRGGSGGGS